MVRQVWEHLKGFSRGGPCRSHDAAATANTRLGIKFQIAGGRVVNTHRCNIGIVLLPHQGSCIDPVGGEAANTDSQLQDRCGERIGHTLKNPVGPVGGEVHDLVGTTLLFIVTEVNDVVSAVSVLGLEIQLPIGTIVGVNAGVNHAVAPGHSIHLLVGVAVTEPTVPYVELPVVVLSVRAVVIKHRLILSGIEHWRRQVGIDHGNTSIVGGVRLQADGACDWLGLNTGVTGRIHHEGSVTGEQRFTWLDFIAATRSTGGQEQ